MFARLAPLPSNRIADPHRREFNMDPITALFYRRRYNVRLRFLDSKTRVDKNRI